MEAIVIDYWHWFVVATVLVIIELLAPSFFALWMAVAAFITGLAMYFMPDMQWEYQILLFAVMSVLSIVAWRIYYANNPIATDEPLLNRRGEQYVGRVITLKEPIVDGFGKINVDDSTWKIQGEDCPVGTKIKITGLNNVVFSVEIVE